MTTLHIDEVKVLFVGAPIQKLHGRFALVGQRGRHAGSRDDPLDSLDVRC